MHNESSILFHHNFVRFWVSMDVNAAERDPVLQLERGGEHPILCGAEMVPNARFRLQVCMSQPVK